MENKDRFAMTVDGILYTERKEAGMALLAACAGVRGGGGPVHVGKFYGFNLSMRFDGFNHIYVMTVSREWNYWMEMGRDSLGNLKRLHNLLSGIREEIMKAGQKLGTLKQQMASAQEESAREESEMERKDKNTETGVEKEPWTLQKIKEMREKNAGRLKTVRPPKMMKKINGTERM